MGANGTDNRDADQHRLIAESAIAIVNSATHAAPKDTLAALERFYEMVKRHFLEEEHLMSITNYYNLSLHQADHRNIINTIRSLLDRATAADSSKLLDISKLSLIVSDWTTLHFNLFDRKFAEYMKTRLP